MPAASLILAALFAAPAPPAAPNPDLFPLALHRSMELDDLDREIQRLHDTVLLRRGQLEATRRLAKRGLVSREELAKDETEVRSQEAREAESVAFRALKAYERDVTGQAAPNDEAKAFALLLEWVRKQSDISQVEADYRGDQLRRVRALFQRNAVSRQELEDAELALNAATASVSLSRSREAQVLMELAVRRGEAAFDAEEYHRLKSAYLQARVRYFEVTAEGAKRRLDLARDRSRLGLVPPGDLVLFEKAAADAVEGLGSEKKALAEHQAAPPARLAPRKRAS